MHKNANIDYCGIIMLLRAIKKTGALTEKELRKIAVRLAAEMSADIIISL